MVTTYKGNVGHLMQHWTLCELLVLADLHHPTPGLNYIDAHAMAPLAIKNENKGKTAPFITVRDRLPQRRESSYEEAWHALAPEPAKGYPNSAAFVTKLWKGDFSLLLCETDCKTKGELGPWLQDVGKWDRCRRAELFPCDWRKRFKGGLPAPSEMGLKDGALTLVSFDPDMCSRRWNVAKKNLRIIYQEDLEVAMAAMQHLKGGILIHLPTYSALNNPQGAVIASANSIIAGAGFTLLAVVRVDGHMMSLVYARNVQWSAKITRLPDCFSKWLPAR